MGRFSSVRPELFFSFFSFGGAKEKDGRKGVRTFAKKEKGIICPITHGPGVYRARNMIRATVTDSFITFTNDCPEAVRKKMMGDGDEDGSKARWEPNPARERSTVHYELEREGKSVLILRDVTGALVKRVPLRERRGRKSVELPGGANGLFFYEIRTDGQRVESGKLLKAR